MIYYAVPLLLSAGIFLTGRLEARAVAGTAAATAAERATRLMYWAACVGLVVIAGARWETGTDWPPYFEHYQDPTSRSDMEAGYVALVRLVSAITPEYTAFLLVCAAISVGIVAFVCHAVLGPSLPAALVFYSYYFLGSFLGAQRRQFAIALCFLAILWTIRGRPLLFLSSVAAAALFHVSSLVFLPAYLVYHASRRVATPLVIVAAAACVLASFLGLERILLTGLELVDLGSAGAKLIGYASDPRAYEVAGGAGLLAGIAKRGVVIGLVWLASRSGDGDVVVTRLLRLYVLSVVLYVLFMLTVPIFSVLTVPYAITEVILIPLVIARASMPRALVGLALLCYAVLQVTSILSPYWDLYVPYYFFFDGASRPILY